LQSPLILYMSLVEVNLENRSYKVNIGQKLLENISSLAGIDDNYSSVFVYSNPAIAIHYEQRVLNALSDSGITAYALQIPGGERHKTLRSIRKIYDFMLDNRGDRKSVIIALGGGVIGDMAGYAASTYMRGISYVQVPTTILAMVDASVGGKTGVDLPKGKNLVGTFWQPISVIVDVDTLQTLPAREVRSGLAEVVKHGVIFDKSLFEYIGDYSKHLLQCVPETIEHVVEKSIMIKRDIVQADERELGVRTLLNYGHTIAHTIEALTGFRDYKHGEAVGVGMVTEAIISEIMGLAEPGTAKNIAVLLKSLKIPADFPKHLNMEDVLETASLDKKNYSGRMRMALPLEIGRCEIIEDINKKDIEAAINIHLSWSI
jgi:3-dehydroquinate synthase